MKSMSMHWRRLAAGLSALVLAACVSAPAQKAVEPRPPRAGITQFSLEARAVISQTQRADSLRMLWQHTAQDDYLGFASPLGHVMAELQRDAKGARWLTADGEHFEAKRPDELFARLTEVPVPLDALTEWMLGRVTRDADQTQYDERGRLTSARDRGWSVKVLAYESQADEALPSLIELRFDTLRIRLAIESWTL